MRLWIGVFFTIIMLAQLSCVGVRPDPALKATTQRDFEALLDTLAHGWNTNDSELAISVFSEDAIYAEPPEKQLYAGKNEIFEFFGGVDGRSSWMNMEWHNVSFNEERQIGAGEFSFSWEGGQVHGMVSIKVENGLISRWREYFYESDLNWKEFNKPSQF